MTRVIALVILAVLAGLVFTGAHALSASYTVKGTYGAGETLLLAATEAPSNVTSSTGLPIEEVSTLAAFNQTKIGEFCTSTAPGGACSQFVNDTTGAWYFDPSHGLLYIAYWMGSPSTTITVDQPGGGSTSSPGGSPSARTSSSNVTAGPAFFDGLFIAVVIVVAGAAVAGLLLKRSSRHRGRRRR